MRARILRPAAVLTALTLVGASAVSLAGPAAAADVTKVGVQRLSLVGNADPDGSVSDAAVSGNGQWVAFTSEAGNLVPGDDNGAADVFVRNATTGAIIRVSVATTGAQGNDESTTPSLSSTGRFVAFLTDSDNFDPDDQNGSTDLYVRDRDTDSNGVFDEVGKVSTVRYSVSPNGDEPEFGVSDGKISPQGDTVAFVTDQSFVNSDQNDADDVYMRGLTTGTALKRITTGKTTSGGGGGQPTFSGNGRFLAFQSYATDIDGNQFGIFVRDRDTDGNGVYDEANKVSNKIVSLKANGTPSFGLSLYPTISATGRYVGFVNYASDLLTGAVNRAVYVVDRDTDGNGVFGEAGKIGVEIASRSEAGVGAEGSNPVISASGRYVTFESPAATLVANDTGGIRDIFLRDRQANRTVRLSVTPSGAGANNASFNGAFGFAGGSSGGVDDSGNAVFLSLATNLSVRGGATNGLELYRSSLTSGSDSRTYVVRYSASDGALAQQAAQYWNVPVQDLGATGVSALAFIVGLVGGGSNPTPPVPNIGPFTMAATYAAGSDNQAQTDVVSQYFAVDGDQAHAFGAGFMIFVYFLLNPQ